MDRQIEGLQARLDAVQRQVRLMRLTGMVPIAGAAVFLAVRPGISAGRPVQHDDDRVAGALAPHAKTTVLHAPVNIVDSKKHLLVRINAGSATGSGFIETFDTSGNILTFSGAQSSGEGGLSDGESIGSQGRAGVFGDANGGSVETDDKNGTVTFSAP